MIYMYRLKVDEVNLDKFFEEYADQVALYKCTNCGSYYLYFYSTDELDKPFEKVNKVECCGTMEKVGKFTAYESIVLGVYGDIGISTIDYIRRMIGEGVIVVRDLI